MTISNAKIIQLLDLTNLNDNSDAVAIAELCQSAQTPVGNVAAVCIYAQHVKLAKKCLANTNIKVATVVNFPDGNTNIEQIIQKTQQAILAGADEIDIVFPYQAYLANNKTQALAAINACQQQLTHNHTLKVILETGAFPNQDFLYQTASDLLTLPINFLKTSTGKIPTGATHAAVDTLLRAIKAAKTPVGIKISGGVKTAAVAQEYCSLIAEHMGWDWVKAANVRFGASQLLEELLL